MLVDGTSCSPNLPKLLVLTTLAAENVAADSSRQPIQKAWHIVRACTFLLCQLTAVHGENVSKCAMHYLRLLGVFNYELRCADSCCVTLRLARQ